MQRIPDAVFQTLQRQGAEEDQGCGSRRQSSTEGGPTLVQRTRSQARQFSLPFASDGPYASPSPPSTPPPFDSEASRHSRHSRPEIPCGGRGGVERRTGVDSIGAETAIQATQSIRPLSGPRALGATSRTTAAETVPSQLLGRRVEGHARLLGSDATDVAIPLEQREADKEREVGSVRSSPPLPSTRNTREEADLTPVQSDEDAAAKHKPSRASESESSFASTSKSSKSYASSFAYPLRDHRNNMRLFKKKSRPLQHVKKSRPSVPQVLSPQRTSPYFKPKIVQDTATLLAPAPSQISPDLSFGLKPPSHSARSERQEIRKIRSSLSQSTSDSAPLLTTPPLRHPVIPLYSRDHGFNRPPHRSRYQPTGSSSASGPHSRESSRSHQHLHDSPSAPTLHKRRYRSDTPPEEEPRLPFESANRHGSHYFRTFGTDTVYQNADVEPLTRVPPNKLAQQGTLEDKPSPAASRSPSPSPNPPSETPDELARSHKHTSVFGSLRYHGKPHQAFHGRRGDNTTPISPTPNITVSSPQLAKSRRISTITSYFVRPRRLQHSSEASPSPAASGLSTNWENVFAESQPAGHVKEHSEPMSPLTIPQSVKRPKPTPVQDRTPERPRECPGETAVSMVPSGTSVGPQPKFKSPSDEEFFKRPRSVPKTLSFLPTEMKRIDTPPISDKPRGFKSFFFDMRSIPEKREDDEPGPPEAGALKRRTPILHMRSVQSLASKLSFTKLKRKSSQTVEERRISEDPLTITGFQQTPFSQRYGDARRAKMSQIRSYMKEALHEDEEGEDSAVPFVLNVPDHLPNSPLCPLSPKHSSGGKAICPIHRRKRTTVTMPPSRPTKALRQGPTIVFESREQGGGLDTPGVEDLRRGIRGER